MSSSAGNSKSLLINGFKNEFRISEPVSQSLIASSYIVPVKNIPAMALSADPRTEALR